VTRRPSILVLAALAGAGTSACAVSVPTYRMQLGAPPRQAIRTVEEALVGEGFQCAVVDPERGALATTWRDSGYRVTVPLTSNDEYPREASIFRRYEVVAYPRPEGAEVRLRVQARRCEPPVRASDVPLGCHEADWDGAVLRHDLAALAQRLARRTNTPVVSMGH
jgi:hypothetical protein